MTAIVQLRGVELAYPIYSIRAQSLRNAIANMAVGGKLLRDGQDIIYVKALDKIDFELREGDRLGIIGHNGAGKTTLLKVIAGVFEPDRGLVEVGGKVSSMIDIGFGLDPALTGRENLMIMGRLRGFSAKQMLDKTPDIIEFSELGAYIDLPVKTYSAGMTGRLIFACGTSLDPDVLLLDEWISTGDASFHEKAAQRMSDILAKSRILVLATHDMGMIQRLCNKLLVLDGGSQTYFGDTKAWDFGTNSPLAVTLMG
jgi:lipopolysaccharide transport system ATP-binding protein